ncbi:MULTISPECIES: hypothetical protein [unclassified Methylophaga]|jgi:hypothetical protein|nr:MULTISPECIES: hypothetical protein [unclassified Methylophaga]MAL50077.1 hypothetical protein [Methylophaga sp.]MBP24160.1 hypothetical protein [Methylophaga sp.]HCC82942.1 hypothetical protein [Methylophaga sp.]|tara:strand:- start:26119 stop:26622 length:504 start_codon:yes stop_codon:yes gene_type:complete
MELIPYIGLGLVVLILPLAIFSGILFLIWKKVPFGKYVSALLLVGFLFVVVTAIWPMDSFYKDELQNNAGLRLDDGYEVLAKSSSYPDMHGDYYSEAVFRVSELDLSTLTGDVAPIGQCVVPRMAEPFLPSQKGAIKCWGANRNIDEWFQLIYFPDSGILYYRFDQT